MCLNSAVGEFQSKFCKGYEILQQVYGNPLCFRRHCSKVHYSSHCVKFSKTKKQKKNYIYIYFKKILFSQKKIKNINFCFLKKNIVSYKIKLGPDLLRLVSFLSLDNRFGGEESLKVYF